MYIVMTVVGVYTEFLKRGTLTVVMQSMLKNFADYLFMRGVAVNLRTYAMLIE